MANRLQITYRYSNTAWVITCEVTSTDAEFPRDIFLWTLNDNGSLNEFQSIGSVDQLARTPTFDSNRTSNFGIHLVKTNTSTTMTDSVETRDTAITVLKSAFDILLASYAASSTPVVEIYP